MNLNANVMLLLPAVFTSSIRYLQGLKTAIIEGHEVGGTCVNRGCVPSKALLAASGRVRDMKNEMHLRSLGIQVRRDGKYMRMTCIWFMLRCYVGMIWVWSGYGTFGEARQPGIIALCTQIPWDALRKLQQSTCAGEIGWGGGGGGGILRGIITSESWVCFRLAVWVSIDSQLLIMLRTWQAPSNRICRSPWKQLEW